MTDQLPRKLHVNKCGVLNFDTETSKETHVFDSFGIVPIKRSSIIWTAVTLYSTMNRNKILMRTFAFIGASPFRRCFLLKLSLKTSCV